MGERGRGVEVDASLKQWNSVKKHTCMYVKKHTMHTYMHTYIHAYVHTLIFGGNCLFYGQNKVM